MQNGMKHGELLRLLLLRRYRGALLTEFALFRVTDAEPISAWKR